MRLPEIIACSLLFLVCSNSPAQNPMPVQEGAFPVRVNRLSLDQNHVAVNFSLPEPARVSLTFREISGNISLTRHLGELPAGNYQRSFGWNGLPAGRYRVILQSGHSAVEMPLNLCGE